jgi:hypothetical protein
MNNPGPHHVRGASHERRDINFAAVMQFGAGLAAVSVAVYAIVWLLFGYFAGREAAEVRPQYPLAATEASRLPPEPRLQTAPRQDLRDLRQREQEMLNGYHWVDRAAGIVRIPIKDAMQLTLERGLPARPGGTVGR